MNPDKNILSARLIQIRKSTTAQVALLAFAILLSLLVPNRTSAAAGDQPSEEKPRTVVAVFHIHGPLTEVPADDAFQLFGSRELR